MKRTLVTRNATLYDSIVNLDVTWSWSHPPNCIATFIASCYLFCCNTVQAVKTTLPPQKKQLSRLVLQVDSIILPFKTLMAASCLLTTASLQPRGYRLAIAPRHVWDHRSTCAQQVSRAPEKTGNSTHRCASRWRRGGIRVGGPPKPSNTPRIDDSLGRTSRTAW